MPYAVIFDMDGVLVDSYHAHFESWERGATEIGREMSISQFNRTFGRTSREIIAEHWGQGTLSEAEMFRFDERKESLYREIVAKAFPAMEGAVELIRELHAAGFQLAIGSSGPPENIEMVLGKLGVKSLFHAVVTGRDVTRGKPDPQVFLTAAAKLQIEPGRCAVIEDAPAGIAAAIAAGMTSIALLSTGHTADSVAAARLTVLSLRELSAKRIAALIDKEHPVPKW